MALIKCSECGGTISDKAKACPHCGCPIEGNEIEEKKVISKGKMSIASIVSFIISTIIFFLIISNVTYGKNYKSSASMIRILRYVRVTIPFILIYGLSIFIAFLYRIKKKFSFQVVSKTLYVVAAISLSIFGFLAAKNGYQLNLFFSFHYLLLIILCLIFPIKKDKNKNIRLSIISALLILCLCVVISSITLSKSNIKRPDNTPKEVIPEEKIIIDLKTVKDGYKAYVKIENEYINVRKCGKTSCDKVGKVLKDDIFEIIEVTYDNNYHWYKIKDKENHEGYIANPKKNNYIKTLEELENSVEVSTITDFKEEKKEEKPVEDTSKNTNTNNNTNTNTNTNNTNKNNNKTNNTTNNKTNNTTPTPTPKPSENTNTQDKPKRTIDATPVYGCKTGEQLDGTRCYAVLDADEDFRCPSGYTLAYHDQCRTNDATSVTPEYYCYSGRLVGNKCVSDYGTTNASARCPDYRYTFSGYSCTMEQEYRYIDASFYGYKCFENGVLKGNMCYYYSDATIKSYSCPNGYTLNDKTCIEN